MFIQTETMSIMLEKKIASSSYTLPWRLNLTCFQTATRANSVDRGRFPITLQQLTRLAKFVQLTWAFTLRVISLLISQ